MHQFAYTAVWDPCSKADDSSASVDRIKNDLLSENTVLPRGNTEETEGNMCCVREAAGGYIMACGNTCISAGWWCGIREAGTKKQCAIAPTCPPQITTQTSSAHDHKGFNLIPAHVRRRDVSKRPSLNTITPCPHTNSCFMCVMGNNTRLPEGLQFFNGKIN